MNRKAFLAKYLAVRVADAKKEVAHAKSVTKILTKTLPEQIHPEVAKHFLMSKEKCGLLGKLRKPDDAAKRLTDTIFELNASWFEHDKPEPK